MQLFPELYSFVKKPTLSLKAVWEQPEFSEHFNLPLSLQAYEQMQELSKILVQLDLEQGKDIWTYIWGNGNYSTSKAYKVMEGNINVDRVYKWLWQSSCQPKHLVFFWLLLKDRVNTRGTLKRRNMILDSYVCELCILQKEETSFHLFIRCNFAKECWRSIGLNLPRHLQIIPLVKWIKRKLNNTFYMDIIILLCWSIWKERNNWLFEGIDPTVDNCRRRFFSELNLIVHRARKGHAEPLKQRIQSNI